MDDKAFQELLENTRLAAEWLKGNDTASRITLVGEPYPRDTRPDASRCKAQHAT
jgi:hypothetical protein